MCIYVFICICMLQAIYLYLPHVFMSAVYKVLPIISYKPYTLMLFNLSYICVLYIHSYNYIHIGYGRIPRSRESLSLYGQAQELTMVTYIYPTIPLLLCYTTI